jgi:hypothetical protein
LFGLFAYAEARWPEGRRFLGIEQPDPNPDAGNLRVPDGAPRRALLSFTRVFMRVLFVVFVLSLVALVWTIVALRRYIRNHDAHGSEPLSLEGSKNDDPLGNID